MVENHTLQSLLRGLSAFGDSPAIIAVHDDALETWSFAELADKAVRLTAGMMKRGVAPGEPVALVVANRPESVAARLALAAAGALTVALDDQSAGEDLRRAISENGCRRVFTARAHLSALPGPGDSAGLEVILLDDGGEATSGVRGWRSLLADEAGTFPDIMPDQPAALLHTSGTTGEPKGVVLNHRNIMAALDGLLAQRLFGPGDRVLVPLPLHHSYPFLAGTLTALASGATVVFPAGGSMPQIIHALQAGQATAIVGVPRLYAALVSAIEAKDGDRGAEWLRGLSKRLRRRLGPRVGGLLYRRLGSEIGPNLRLLVSSGARLDPGLVGKLESLGWQALSGYGLAETASIVTFNPCGRARPETAGLPVPGVELRIDAPEQGGPGEVLVRGPSVFAGYHNHPEATRAGFTADGWFRTGDLGFLDGDGHLRIVGRSKEVIRLTGDKTGFPEEMEAVFAESPFVQEAAFLDHDGALVALVVPDLEAIRRAGTGRLKDLLRVTLATLSLRLPPDKRISSYAIAREALPRTHLGNLRRHLLPAIYAREGKHASPSPGAELSASDRALLATGEARRAWSWLLARYPHETLTLDTCPQLHLDVDSLEWLKLSLEMREQLGIVLSEEAIARVVTLRDLLREVVSAKPAGASAPPADYFTRPEEALTSDRARWLERPGPALGALGMVLYIANRAIIRGAFGLTVEGADKLPEEGPFVVAVNHQSDLDHFVVAAAVSWRKLRRTHWGADRGRLFTSRVRRLLCRACNVLPVDDYVSGATLASGCAVLKRKKSLIWFPEGWLSPDGNLQPFARGIGVLLKHSGAAVIPAYLSGTFEALPRWRKLPRLTPFKVVFGDPLDPAELEAEGEEGEPYARIANALRDAMEDLAEKAKTRAPRHGG